MSNFKKLFTIAVTAMTVIWSVGIVSVPTVQAAASAGDLIKMAGNSAVYYFDGSKRFVFPNQDTYMSWYKDFSGVKTVPSSELMSYTIGGNVTMRAGTWLVKITTDPKVYAVSTGGKLHAIDSEARAAKLYGSNWNKIIKDVSDAFFVNYTVDTAIISDMHPNGAVIKYANNSTYYYVEGGKKRAFASEAALAANMINTAFTVTTDITYGDGSSVTGKEAAMTNVAGSSVNNGGPVSTGSGLSVSAASDNPVSASVPKSGTNVKFLALNFTAGNDGAVVVDGFTLHRSGVGSSTNFAGVYVYDGSNRLTSARTINSSSNEVSFTGLNLSIPAGATQKLYVTADVGSSVTSGQTSNLELLSSSAVTTVGSGVTVSGNFPVVGNMMTFVDVTIGTLTVSKSGSVSTPKVGQSMAKVSEFKLAASTEDISVNRVTLYQAGSISRSNLTNFKLRVQGSSTDLATASTVNTKDLVVFQLATPYSITQGNDRIFEVFADIGGSAKANDTIKLYVDETSDISATGQTYGFGSIISSTFNSSTNHSLTLEGGKLTVTFEGPTNTTISKNTSDYVVYKFNMSAAQGMEVRKMSFTLASPSEDNDTDDTSGLVYDTSANTPDTLNFQDIKVKDLDSGLIVTSTKELSASGADDTQNVVFTDYFTLAAGTTRHFALLVDVKDTNPNGNDLKVTMLLDTTQTDFSAKSLDTSDFITDIVPSVDLVGNVITVNTSALAIGVASTPVSDTYVKRTTGIPAVGFTFQAGTASDITVTSIKLTGLVDDDASGVFTANVSGAVDINNLVNSVRLYEGDDMSKPLADAKSLSSDGTVTFSGLTWKIAAGTTYKLVARADASDSVAANNRIKFDIAVTTDVSAQDKDSNTASVTGTAPNQTTVDAGTRVTFATAGSLSVIKDAATPNSGIVLSGTNNVLFTAVKWSATREDFEVKKFNITQTTSGANGLISGIRVSYKNAAGTTVTAGPYALDSNGTAAIDISTNPLVVKKGDTSVLSIYADVASFATIDGTDSGKAPVLNLQALNATPTGGIAWEAVGTSSGTSLGNSDAITTAVIPSNTQLVYKAYPTLTTPTWTPVSTPTNSEMEIYKWGVAATGNSIAVKQMGLKITISDSGTDTTETLGNFKLYRDSSDITSQVRIVDQGGADLKASTSFAEADTTAYIVFGSDAQSEETIPAGSTYNYVLRATAAGFTTPADDDSFRVEMLSDSAATAGRKQLGDKIEANSSIVAVLTGGADATEEALPQYIIWSDNSAIPHSAAVPEDNTTDPAATSSGDWTNGYLVKNMPLSQTSFVY